MQNAAWQGTCLGIKIKGEVMFYATVDLSYCCEVRVPEPWEAKGATWVFDHVTGGRLWRSGAALTPLQDASSQITFLYCQLFVLYVVIDEKPL